MAENKTKATEVTVEDFLAGVEPPERLADARALLKIFAEVTGVQPKMWGPSIIGYGSYHYRYESGREGDMCATGFSPRKAELVLYILPGYQDYGALLADLGKHRLGKACLYIKRLGDVREDLLRQLISQGLRDLGKLHPVVLS
jgi:hypothetical protein